MTSPASLPFSEAAATASAVTCDGGQPARTVVVQLTEEELLILATLAERAAVKHDEPARLASISARLTAACAPTPEAELLPFIVQLRCPWCEGSVEVHDGGWRCTASPVVPHGEPADDDRCDWQDDDPHAALRCPHCDGQCLAEVNVAVLHCAAQVNVEDGQVNIKVDSPLYGDWEGDGWTCLGCRKLLALPEDGFDDIDYC